MSEALLFGLAAAAVVGIGFCGVVARSHLLHRLMALNVVGSGIFLLLGALGARAPETTDPVPQAMAITGIVVALASTALAISLAVRLSEQSGRPTLPEENAYPSQVSGRARSAADDEGRT